MRQAFLIVAALLVAGAAQAAEGDAQRGEMLFADCVSCHGLVEGEHGVGPSLHNLLGRKAGGLADFRYSPALRNSNIVWSAQTLNTYLEDPQKMVPGNRMPYAGMIEAKDRADLIAYLMRVANERR